MTSGCYNKNYFNLEMMPKVKLGSALNLEQKKVARGRVILHFVMGQV